jgi:hypothetical protein
VTADAEVPPKVVQLGTEEAEDLVPASLVESSDET